MREQLEAGRIDPLQIVEKQDERVFGTGEYAKKAAEHQLEAYLPVLRRELGDGRLLADDKRELRNQVDHELTVGPERFLQRLPPEVELRILAAEQLTNEAVKRLRQRRVRDV